MKEAICPHIRGMIIHIFNFMVDNNGNEDNDSDNKSNSIH